jgi:hypothetical protein
MDEKPSTQGPDITGDANVGGDGSTSQVIKAENGSTISNVIQAQGDVIISAPSRLSTGAPFQAPAVPRYFVPRSKVSDDLKHLLLADEARAPGALVVSAVHGLGGIGKTTLVAALAHDPDLQARFLDGILWATLGQEPEVLSRLHEWIQSLGDYAYHPTTVDGASAHLRTLLHDKACLLVVDDAWNANNARAFLVGGECCQVLVTTRDARLAHKIGARLYDLDVMTEAQALALFEARLGPLDGEREGAAALAGELGYLPLALELAAAQVEGGFTWTELLVAFRQGLADLAVLDLDEASYRNESLRLSFRLSLGQISPEDQEAFAWLGVLPEDVRLTPDMAATLWDGLEAETRKRLRRLRDKALLKSVGEDSYTLHDLLHDEARLRLTERTPLQEAHAALLARYQARCRGKSPTVQWYTLPDDGYIHERLTWHMEQANQEEAIHALLCLETEEGRNAWYETREAMGQTAGYLADVHRALRLAEEDFASHQSQTAVGLQCRYALIIASLNSLAGGIPPALVVALVERGLWSPDQGLAYARRTPDPNQRTETLTGLAFQLAKMGYPSHALAVAQGIENQEGRPKILAELAFQLSESGHLREAVLALEAMRDIIGWALEELAPRMPRALLQEAWAMARQIENDNLRVRAQVILAPHLPHPEREQAAREALAAVQTLRQENRLTMVFLEDEAQLALHLPEPEQNQTLRQVLAATREIILNVNGVNMRAKTLARLAHHLPVVLKQEALREALEVAQAKEREWGLVRTLEALGPLFAEAGYPEEPLRVALTIDSKDCRAKALARLASHQPQPIRGQVLQEALRLARESEFEHVRDEVMTAVAPQLAELGCPGEALEVAQAIKRRSEQTKPLTDVACQLAKVNLCQEALVAVRSIESEPDRARALVELAPYLEEVGVLEETLVTASEMGEWAQGQALAGLAPQQAKLGYPREALTLVRSIKDPREQAKALTGLAPNLFEGALLQDALEIAKDLPEREGLDPGPRMEAIAGLAPHLRDELLVKALAIARRINDTDYEPRAMIGLVPYLQQPMRGQEIAALKGPLKESGHEQMLAWLALQLAELGHPQEALETVQEIGSARDRVETLVRLIPHLPEPEPALLEELAKVQAEEWETDRAEALVELAPYLLSEPLLLKALAMAQAIEGEHCRSEALSGLAPYLLSEHLLLKALAMAQAIEREHCRLEALSGLAPRLPEPQRKHALQEALTLARAMNSGMWQATALAALAPHLSAPEQILVIQEAVTAAQSIEDKGQRAEAMASLASQLPEAEQEQIWQELQELLSRACSIADELDIAKALAKLVPHLPDSLVRELPTWYGYLPGGDYREHRSPRAEVGIPLASRLVKLGYPTEALETVDKIYDEINRQEAVVELWPQLRDSGYFTEALTVVGWIEDNREQADALTTLAPKLSKDLLPKALEVARGIENDRWKAWAMAALARRSAENPPPELHPVWKDTLEVFARCTREDMFLDVYMLSPVIAKLGGEEAILETLRAIQDVGRWWP